MNVSPRIHTNFFGANLSNQFFVVINIKRLGNAPFWTFALRNSKWPPGCRNPTVLSSVFFDPRGHRLRTNLWRICKCVSGILTRTDFTHKLLLYTCKVPRVNQIYVKKCCKIKSLTIWCNKETWRLSIFL